MAASTAARPDSRNTGTPLEEEILPESMVAALLPMSEPGDASSRRRQSLVAFGSGSDSASAADADRLRGSTPGRGGHLPHAAAAAAGGASVGGGFGSGVENTTPPTGLDYEPDKSSDRVPYAQAAAAGGPGSGDLRARGVLLAASSPAADSKAARVFTFASGSPAGAANAGPPGAAGETTPDDEVSEGGDELGCCAVEGKNLGYRGWVVHHWLVSGAHMITFSPLFEGFIVLCILLSGALVGAQLYPVAREPDAAAVISVLDTVVVAIFTVEVVIRILAEGTAPVEYFRSPANGLDFVVVVLSYMPFEDTGGGVGTATIIRTIRLLRLLKLVKAVPQLRVLVLGVAESVGAIGYIFMLLLLLIFICGVAGNSWFARNDPFNFGTLDQAMITVFRAGEAPRCLRAVAPSSSAAAASRATRPRLCSCSRHAAPRPPAPTPPPQ